MRRLECVLVIRAVVFVTAAQLRGYICIARVLAVCLRALEFTHYNLYCSLATSQPRAPVELSSPILHTCGGLKVDTHNPSAIVTLLAKHVGDCDSEGL